MLDGGAYATLSGVVLSRGMIHASGPYRCDHIRARGRVTMTNTPPNGAFRGFGAPQTQFAVEAHMDVIADRLGIDPLRLRERNALRPGDTTATGQKVGKDCSALRGAARGGTPHELLEATESAQGIEPRHRPVAVLPRVRLHRRRRGEAGLEGVTRLDRARRADSRRQHGDRSGHADHARADRRRYAGHSLRSVDVSAADTATVPDSGPTVASRTCMIVGRLLQRCAEEMRTRLGRMTPAAYWKKHGGFVVTTQYEKPPGLEWDDETYRGDAYGSYGWGCDVVEVEVDPVTYQATPVAFTTVHEIGRAIHPMLAAGQIEGGSSQGLGYALLEEVVMRDGRMANAQLTNYIIPTTLDTPPMTIKILESPYAHGPFGAKGVGRDADRWSGARRRQCAQARRGRHLGDSGDAREDHAGETAADGLRDVEAGL